MPEGLGVALSTVPDVLNGFFRDLSLLGNVFAPVAGVLVFNYLLVRRMRIDVAALFRPAGSLSLLAWAQSHRRRLDGDR